MAMFPMTSTTGDPVFRAQNTAINTIKRFTRGAADASQKLNTQERIVNPGDDVLAFNVSRRIRSDIGALRTVAETGQLQVSGLGLAIEGLDSIKTQLEQIKRNLVQSQAADTNERALIQGQIDLALQQIDSTAQNTKLGSRTLIDGGSTIKAFQSVAANGEITDFDAFANGDNVNANEGIIGVRVNQLGTAGTTRTLDDGRQVLSLNVSILSGNKGTRAQLTIDNGQAGEFAEFRITGRLGSAILRLDGSWDDAITGNIGQVAAFNRIAQETGVVISYSTANDDIKLTSVGFGSNEFIRVEKLNAGANGNDATIGAIAAGTPAIGATQTAFGTAAQARVNGELVELGGEWGTTIQYKKLGFDIEIDINSNQLGATDAATDFAQTINVDLAQGITGILGSSGRAGDQLQYGFGTYTTGTLGRGAILNTTTDVGDGSTIAEAVAAGGQVVGLNVVGDMASGGRLSLESGNVLNAIKTVDKAISQVIQEQSRLGSIQSTFIGAINRAENQIGNLASADADIIGVDAATEITNLIQSQLGVSTASSVLSQANAIQANIFSLLRG